jgi:hypothetical protein
MEAVALRVKVPVFTGVFVLVAVSVNVFTGVPV